MMAALVVAIAFLGVGCVASDELPSGVQISCNNPDECPSGFSCRLEVHRCFRIGADSEPPTIVNGEVELDRSVVGAGQTVTIAFSVSKPLEIDPRVQWLWFGAGPEAGLAELVSATADLRYTYQYTSDGNESEGLAALRISLVDRSGNAGGAELPPLLEFDRTAPTLSAETINVQVLPGVDNVLPHPSQATTGTIVQIAFATNEPLAGTPNAWIQAHTGAGQAPRYALEYVRQSGAIYFFAFTFFATDYLEGPYDLEVEAADLAGNTGTTVVEQVLVVDLSPPPPPDVASDGRIVYGRAPWGTSATQGATHMTLSGSALAVEPSATVIAYDGATPPRVELGRAIADDTGAFGPALLLPTDRPVVYVAQADAAGNLSPVVHVRNLRWVATLGQKVAGSTFENPNALFERTLFSNAAQVGSPEPEASGSEVGTRDGSTARVIGARGRWRNGRRFLGLRKARHRVMATDTLRGHVVTYAGFNATPLYSGNMDPQLYKWDGLAFSGLSNADKAGDGYPPNRANYVGAYDAIRDRVVYYSRGVASDDDELWEWDGSSWRNVRPLTLGPEGEPSLPLAVMAPVPSLGVLLYANGESWRWDGFAWQQLILAGQPPSVHAAVAADVTSNSVILFGGIDGLGNYLDETWRFDGLSWSPVAIDDPEGDGKPSARDYHGLAFDPGRGVYVLFGGRNLSGPLDDVWELHDGNHWVHRCDGVPAEDVCGSGPVARSDFGMAYDSERGQVLIDSGWLLATAGSSVQANNGANYVEDLWGFDGTLWRQLAWPKPAGNDAKPQGVDAAVAFDQQQDCVVLFGGLGPAGPSADTTVHDGVWWRQVNPGSSPSARGAHAMAYDSERGRTVLFGGYTGTASTEMKDTWELYWNVTAWAWTNRCTSCAPAARRGHSLAYDKKRKLSVMFGGHNGTSTLAETWEWNGNTGTWDQRCEGVPAGDVCGSGADLPSAQAGGVLVYDETHEHVLLLSNPGLEVFSFDGAQWRRIAPIDGISPPARDRFSAAYDGLQVIMMGGEISNVPQKDAWLWNGERWYPATSADPEGDGDPPLLSRHVMTYDPNAGRAILAGGSTTNALSNIGPWLWLNAYGERPAAVVRLDLAAARIVSGSSIAALSLRASAGGSGTLVGQPLTGANVFVRRGAVWLPAGTSTSDPSSPDDIAFDVPMNDLPGTIDLGELLLAITPAGANDRDPAEVAVDDVEATLIYRLPPVLP